MRITPKIQFFLAFQQRSNTIVETYNSFFVKAGLNAGFPGFVGIVKKIRFILWITVALQAAVFSVYAQDFRVGSGDRLTITVYEHDDLSMSVRISEEGTIKVPFLGDVAVAGMTTGQIAEKLSQEFVAQEYLINPQITVFIDEYRSRKASILGEVTRPGRYELEEDTTVMILVTMASGFSPKASKKHANIIRKKDGKTEILEKVSMDERVMPGDIVVIPESFF